MKIIDGFGNKLSFDKPPQRLISLIPCVTETLLELGASDRLRGITDYCIKPKSKVESIIKVGGPKSLNMDAIKNINPDLIFMDPEENILDDYNKLKESYPIFVVNVKTIADSIAFLDIICQLLDSKDKAEHEIIKIKYLWDLLKKKYTTGKQYKLLILLWKNPYFSMGGNTYINNLIKECGFSNIFQDRQGYFKIEASTIIENKPDIIFLPDEPYSFSEDDKIDLADIFEGNARYPKIEIVDGTNLCWYGYRTAIGLEYFDEINEKIRKI